MSDSGTKILTWNCNGALRRKWAALEAFDADLLIVQECEDPAQSKDAAYLEWAGHYLWTGPSKSRGIGVFARNGHTLQAAPLELDGLEYFLPCLVNGDWPLLGTWTGRAGSGPYRYIGQLWRFLQSHQSFLTHHLGMVVGDLNSNCIWDKRHRTCNHSDVVRELAALGLESAYHRHFGEAQGQETRNTFYLQRNPAKGYHIDYVFSGPGWGPGAISVEDRDTWLAITDHVPVVATFPAA